MATTRPGRPTKKQKMRKSKVERVCDLCHEKILKGDLYSVTNRGTVYCKKCE